MTDSLPNGLKISTASASGFQKPQMNLPQTILEYERLKNSLILHNTGDDPYELELSLEDLENILHLKHNCEDRED